MMMDWTYDLFLADCKAYDATPIKGVHPSRWASDREVFMVAMKNAARDFVADWNRKHGGLYARGYGWVGDAFNDVLCNCLYFSDYYKDTYGQRPHLPAWYYIHALGLPTGQDTIRLFCANPIEDAAMDAEETRKALEAM